MKDINRIKKMIRVVVYAIGFGLIIGGGIGIAYLNKIDKEYISTMEKRRIKVQPKSVNSWEIYLIRYISYIILSCICSMPGYGAKSHISLSPSHGR